MKTLEIQERLNEAFACRIAINNGSNIGAQGVGNVRDVFDGAIEGIDHHAQADNIVVQSCRNTMKNGCFKSRLVEDRINEQWCQHWRLAIGFFRFETKPGPQCIGQFLLSELTARRIADDQ